MLLDRWRPCSVATFAQPRRLCSAPLDQASRAPIVQASRAVVSPDAAWHPLLHRYEGGQFSYNEEGGARIYAAEYDTLNSGMPTTWTNMHDAGIPCALCMRKIVKSKTLVRPAAGGSFG